MIYVEWEYAQCNVGTCRICSQCLVLMSINKATVMTRVNQYVAVIAWLLKATQTRETLSRNCASGHVILDYLNVRIGSLCVHNFSSL